mmetsp:Transcript_60380/g.143923  ORF Transcript_60380/g.143923 Transcript_60380/m.143923 type:complete len:208 (+) Transcript_60380:1393-2016(+)
MRICQDHGPWHCCWRPDCDRQCGRDNRCRPETGFQTHRSQGTGNKADQGRQRLLPRSPGNWQWSAAEGDNDWPEGRCGTGQRSCHQVSHRADQCCEPSSRSCGRESRSGHWCSGWPRSTRTCRHWRRCLCGAAQRCPGPATGAAATSGPAGPTVPSPGRGGCSRSGRVNARASAGAAATAATSSSPAGAALGGDAAAAGWAGSSYKR